MPAAGSSLDAYAQVVVLRGLRTCLAEALAQVTAAAGNLYLQADASDHLQLFTTARDSICACADSITQVICLIAL